MKKVNKALMSTVAILLSLVLITTSVVSGIFAKFVDTKSAGSTVSLKAFGLTLTVSSPSGYNPVYTPPAGNAISVTVPITMTAAENYDDIVKFTLSNTPNVDKVKLILTMKIEGVANFAVSGIEGIPNGNHIPLGFTSRIGLPTSGKYTGRKLNTPNYWCMPASNENLVKTIIDNTVADYNGEFKTINAAVKFNATSDDSLEVVVWENNAYNFVSFELGARPFGTTLTNTTTGYNDIGLSDDEARILQAYLAERTNPAPQLKITYTVSLEQVIPTTTNS